MNNPSLLRLSVAAGVAFALHLPQAQAQQSPPLPFDATFSLPAAPAGPCTFPVRIDVVGKQGILALPRGVTIFTAPMQFATVTNLTTSASIRLTATGAFKVTTDQNANIVTTVTGRNILLDPVAGLVLGSGIFSFVFDNLENLVTPLNGTGRLVNICSMVE
ncbi:MAG: hypothetical protein EOP82_10395 [Variovorax sp.]|nr:MAG: hypothetical protein EOP82_10395 [Variovorax sp.]